MLYYGRCQRWDHMHTLEAGCWETRWRDQVEREPVEIDNMGRESRQREAAMELLSGTKDARGRVLEEGDEIILNVRSVYFRIASITPVLDPSAPPDMLMVHVGAMIPFYCKRGAINQEFVRVRSRAEAGPTNFEVLEAKADPDGAGKPLAVTKEDPEPRSER